MKRILMLSYNRMGRGTYWRAWGFARELAQRHYDVTLMAVSADHKIGFCQRRQDGVLIVESPDLFPTSGYDPWDALNRIIWLWSRPYDLIHSFETRPINLLPALSVHWRQKASLVVDWCDWFGRGGSVEQRPWWVRLGLSPLETLFETAFRRIPQGTTVINNVLSARALEMGVAGNSIMHLPNGANVDEIRPLDKQAVRLSLGLPVDVPIVAYTGAMFAGDARLMAAAFDRLRNYVPQARLLLIGYNNIDVKSLVATPDAVDVTGPISYDSLVRYLAATDVGWLPLQNNGANQGRFPMKAHDFMAAGRPIVVTDVGDLGAFVREEGVGWVSVDTPEALAETTAVALSDTVTCHQIGQQARRVAETKYAWPMVTDRLEMFYRTIWQ